MKECVKKREKSPNLSIRECAWRFCDVSFILLPPTKKTHFPFHRDLFAESANIQEVINKKYRFKEL